MRRVLLVAFAAVSVNIVTTESATASQILFMAPQLPCFGTTLPLTCFGGGPGFPIVWQGPNYVPVNLPANSLIEEIDLWGEDAEAVGIWDSTIQPPPFLPIVLPSHELAAFRDSIDYTITPFGNDGFDGTPYFFFQGTLDDPIFLQNGGRYYVGVAGLGMVGGSGVIWRTSAFATDVDRTTLSGTSPGMAIQVVGQVVPEPSTFVLFGLGLMLLCLRTLLSGPSTR